MRIWSRLVFLGCVLAVAARTAHADVDSAPPLVVIVEIGAGAGCDAGDVRQAIRAELGSAIAAPSEPRASEATRALLVAVERSQVVMVLYRDAAAPLARTIPVPAERGARVRAIAWLARNMERDQVSGVVVAAHAPLPPEAAITPVIPADFPALAPPRLSETADADASAARDAPVVVKSSSTPGPAEPSAWLVTAAGGLSSLPAQAIYSRGYVAPPDVGVGGMAFGGGPAWMLEVQRRTSTGRLMGIALDARGWDRFGTAAYIGSRWARGRWALEPTIGAGIELATTMVRYSSITDSSISGVSSTTRVESAMRPALYLRGGLAGFVDVSDSLAIMARVGAHLSMLSDHTDASWLVGVRMKLP